MKGRIAASTPCRLLSLFLSIAVLATMSWAADTPSHERARLDQIEKSLKADVPRVLCLDSSFATGGQPTDQAYAKVAASGFKSVPRLRAANEGVDLGRERS